MKKEKNIEMKAIIVFSESRNARNHLCRQVDESGFKAVSYDKEVICLDNIMSIQPRLVIVETEAIDVAWRFILTLHASRFADRLAIVSDFVKTEMFNTYGLRVSMRSETMSRVDHNLIRKLVISADNAVGNEIPAQKNHVPLFVGQNSAIKKISSMLPDIASVRDSVLISGEPGTGKELLSRLIVGLSKTEKTFIKIDCSILSPGLLANGWFKAINANRHEAKPITIFLAHIDQMPLSCQAEILLLIEAYIGSSNRKLLGIQNGIRIVASSDIQIELLVENGRFRKDLFYRLNVIPLYLPALRERRDDIYLLMDYFIIEACARFGNYVIVPSRQARQMLYAHHWPGNIKELQNQMYRVADTGGESCLYANTSISKLIKDKSDDQFSISTLEALPKIHEIKGYLPLIHTTSLRGICDQLVTKTERRLIIKALESTKWNRKKAAKLLKISYKSLLNKLKTYDNI